jgi:hypothetical protein
MKTRLLPVMAHADRCATPLLVVLLLACGSALGGNVSPPRAITPPGTLAAGGPRLEETLDHLSRAAGLYRDSALRFSCDEEIAGSGLGGKTYRFEYIYVYSSSRGFKDYRTDPAARRPREIDLNAYRIPQFLRRAYSWIFVFGEAARKHHRYTIVGEDVAFGRAALKLAFEPIPPFKRDMNEWFGTAWIDSETFQLLKVEALHRDEHRKQKEFEADLARSSTRHPRGRKKRYHIERVSTEFSFEKNGMRFPGKVVITLTELAIPGEDGATPFDESPVYRIEQTYANYRFFSVRTLDEIQAIVSGPSRLAPPP